MRAWYRMILCDIAIYCMICLKLFEYVWHVTFLSVCGNQPKLCFADVIVGYFSLDEYDDIIGVQQCCHMSLFPIFFRPISFDLPSVLTTSIGPCQPQHNALVFLAQSLQQIAVAHVGPAWAALVGWSVACSLYFAKHESILIPQPTGSRSTTHKDCRLIPYSSQALRSWQWTTMACSWWLRWFWYWWQKSS